MTGFVQVGAAYVRADSIVAVAAGNDGGSLVYVPGNVFPCEVPPAELVAQVESQQ